MTNTKLLQQIKALLGDPKLSNDDTLTVITELAEKITDPATPLLFSAAVDPISGRAWVNTNVQNEGDPGVFAQKLEILINALGQVQHSLSQQLIAVQIEAAKQQGLQLAAQENGSGGKK